MKEDKTLEDEYSILNIHKNESETALDWKSYNKNTEAIISKNITILKNESIQELKDSISRIQKEKLDIENISYKRYKQSQMNDKTKINVFQKENQDSFHIEEIDLSDLKFNDEKTKEFYNQETQNDQELKNTDNQELKDADNQELKNTDNQELKNADNQELKNTDNQELKNTDNQKLENTDNQKLKNADNQELKDADNQELKKQSIGLENADNHKSENQSIGIKKSIDPKIQNILKERLSNVLTPRALIKINNSQQDIIDQTNLNVEQTTDIINPFKHSYIGKEKQVNLSTNSTINQVTLNTVKRKLEEEITKNSKHEKIAKPDSGKIEPNENILGELKMKLQNEVKLRKEILNLETTIRLQKLEIDMLRNRELPKNNSKEMIKECKNAICNIKKELKNQEEEFRKNLNNERNMNAKLTKEISSLKSIINNLLVKNNKLDS